jgi:heavy metal sensor kinase
MNKWKIRWRLTIGNMTVLILILVGFASAMLLMLREHLYERDDVVIVEELNELLEELGRHSSNAELVRELEQRFSVHSNYYFQVSLDNHDVLFRSRYLSRIQLPVPEKFEELRGRVFQDLDLPKLGHFRLLTQSIRDSHGTPLLVQVVTSRAALDREFQSYLWITLALLPVGAIAALVSGFLLARWALDPIDRIIGTAERISAETLTERLQVSNSHDELGRLATTLNRMFDRLHRSIDEMRRFTADAAHELRSPLAVMRTEAEVVLRNTRTIDVYQRVIEVNLEETKRLGDLVDQLLTLSRHDAGLLSEMQDDVQLDALVRDVCDRFETVAIEKGVNLQVSFEQPCIVHGDDIALSQLFFNLLDNALKYTPPGGHIHLTEEFAGDKVRITLEDTGIGIPPEHLPHIFERFYRIDYSRNREVGGGGVGLAICKSIVEEHQGEISVTSEPDRGTQFTVLLPYRRDAAGRNHHGAGKVQVPE